MTTRVSRLAPSPTGALHLGNARTFLVNWALARSGGWRLLMRVEDLDGPRVKQDAAMEAIEILEWLGVDFDDAPSFQSHDIEPYRAAMISLASRQLTYGCDLTRTQIEAAASAPHADGHELRYPPELRPTDDRRYRFDLETTNYRLIVPPGRIEIADEVIGATTHDPAAEVGDFVIWTKRGTPAYQLAVVVDDGRQSVTDVVRGEDLLPSAARQLLLYRALELTPPRWWHLPLVIGADGRRLAKRHGDTRLSSYRRAGVRPERIIGLLGSWCGVVASPQEMTADDFRAGFRVDRLDRRSVTFTPEHHRWLLGQPSS